MQSDAKELLFVRLAFWALVAFGVAGLVAFKALGAMRSGKRYRFTFLDGGIVLRGKETSPGLMLGLAAAYAVGMSALLAWPLGLYRWVDDATSGCRDVVTLATVRRMSGVDIQEVRVQELGTMCSFRVSRTDGHPLLDLEISGFGRSGVMPGSVEMPSPIGGRVRRLDKETTSTLWLDGRAGGYMSLALQRDRFDDAEVRELASLLAEHQDILERYALSWRKPRSPVVRALRANASWISIGVVVVALAGGVLVVRLRRARSMRRALDED